MLTLEHLVENDMENDVKKTYQHHACKDDTPRVRQNFLAPVSDAEIPVRYARKKNIDLSCELFGQGHIWFKGCLLYFLLHKF